jgi:hypothetical protein
MTPDLDSNLTTAERAALKRFAANYVAGRRLVCSLFHLVVALGAVGGAIAGIYQGISSAPHLIGGH